MMFSLFGCMKKYNVSYLCNKDSLIGAKDSYRAGQKVTLKLPIATDTDYSFSISDNVPFTQDYDEGYMIYRFTMPKFPIEISLSSYNSMVNVRQIVTEYSFHTTATADLGTYRYYTLEKNKEDYLLTYQSDGDLETYTCDSSILNELTQLIGQYGMAEWNSRADLDFIDGASYSFYFFTGEREVSVTSDHMPENGVQAFRDIEKVFASFCR